MFKLLILFSLCFTPLSAQLRPGTIGTNPSYTKDETDLIEPIPDYKSYINWTKGKLVIEHALPVLYFDPNVGRGVVNSSTRLEERLFVYAYQALTQMRVSSFLTIEDYFLRNKEIRENLLASLYSLPAENMVIKQSMVNGTLVFPLYGPKSISEPFYKNIKNQEITNYLTNKSSIESYYDTLIIDMVMFKDFKPSLMPRILDQKGHLVHGVETVEKSVLNQQGPVHYVTSITEALKHPSRGKKVAYLLPADIEGATLSDIVLFDTDVERVFSQKRSVDFFRKGKVIIIYSSS